MEILWFIQKKKTTKKTIIHRIKLTDFNWNKFKTQTKIL